MRSKTVLLLLCLAGVLARGANAAPIATIVEGESSFMRDASRVALAEGVRLANDDLIDTTAQTKLLRIEFDDGLMLLVAPESRLWIAPKFSADKTDVGRSLAADQRQHSKTPAKPGQGDRGDRQKS